MAGKKFVIMFIALVFLLMGCTSQSKEVKNNVSNKSAEAGTPKEGGTLKVAITGEPPTLDSHLSSAFLASQIGWHIYEGLFTLDENYNAIPMLAKDYEYDEARKTYIINLREGVKFHNGKTLSADDVIASLKRWGEKANYGRIMFNNVKDLRKISDLTIEIELLEPSPIAPILLAYPNQQTAIYPKEVIDKADETGIKEFIGTGPFKFVEHKPDQYIKLEKFKEYVAREEPSNGMGGKKTAHVDEIMFIPTPEASVRYDGVQTGQFHWADSVSTDMYESMKTNTQVEPAIVKPYWWPMAVFNKQKGVFADKKMRQAFALALDMKQIMKASFTSEEFYRLDPSIMFKEQEKWWSDAGSAEMYNKSDIKRAKQLVKEAGYNGEKIRWLTTKEYDYMYNIAVVAAEQLKQIGLNIELEVVDYATIVDKRMKPDEYEVFSGATTFTPDPGIWANWDKKWGGFWVDEEKDKMVNLVNTEMDEVKRKELYDELQAHFWEEVPLVKFGDFFILTAKSPSMKGFEPTPFPFFWNTWIE
ncbi:ABC transporter substrate-binding protein [Neobacillus sp. 19]|uniref:ABC transporter substrate-binding protein n=1 Tax=Neobacillus sp. 19 TaxID=3394458 RepID=UPI003BF666ED